MTTKLSELAFDLASLKAAYAEGLDPVAVVDEVYDRIEARNDPGVFISLVDRETARAAARALGPKPDGRPLWGVPFGIKDSIDFAGLPTTAACREFAYEPARHAPSVERTLAAGAIAIGKTNLDQFATGLVGVRTPYPIPRNTVDPTLVPGGSSSGSAVAVAAGLVPFTLGTDTAGSGRVPAGLNNIVGVKPTVGLTPTSGVVYSVRLVDGVTVFAQTVDDGYAVLGVIGGYDPDDGFSRDMAVPPLGPLPPRTRVAIPDAASRRFGGNAAAEAAFDGTLADVRALGGETVEIDFEPYFAVARMLYEGSWVASRYHQIRDFIEASPEALHPVTREIIEGARTFSAADAYGDVYRLLELRRELGRVWDKVDCMLVPTFPRAHTVEAVLADPISLNSELGTYTNFVNLLDYCALAVPGRPRADGIPAGVTLIGPAGADGRLAALGAAIHAAGGVAIGALGRPAPQPVVRPAVAEAGEIEIVVVGAHLSGMALNGELLKRGGRFLRAVATAPLYRLHLLDGATPRPGLLRVADGSGAAIETEVWALPAASFGPFVAGIPSPLGVGTLRLGDGTSALGFLVEAAGAAGAPDITSFGGWRAYARSLKAA
ncbi:allophanate hydrolase [Methylopila sp. Yamaguchi]|uniref:allophanate hydrolase n=1 Tax=Methylopila sp. Yamaguchi TaxID=1437817 RepID=UPI000CA9BF27|nr:allophanate hydrolase [Methylopila sp. Yamaguchi]GBD50432.1 allophanate hydrolase [Methylopila sp. Yamaguchi]